MQQYVDKTVVNNHMRLKKLKENNLIVFFFFFFGGGGGGLSGNLGDSIL